MSQPLTISIVIPTYRRERVLIDTIDMLEPLLREGDEILVMDQTPEHEPETRQALREWVACGVIRWFQTHEPARCGAMNCAAWRARGDILLYLDDDIIPCETLLEGHRAAHEVDDPPPAVVGQVLQPWHTAPIDSVRGYDIRFDAAYDKPCDVVALMGGNFSVRRLRFIEFGGMDENFWAYIYRDDAELAYRIYQKTGQQIRFSPSASIRHLMASSGGSRAFGGTNSWGDIGGSIGDYYFAMRRLTMRQRWPYCLRRLLREPINRYTIQRPWLIPSLYLREFVAWWRACGRILTKSDNYLKPVEAYAFEEYSSR